MWITSERFGSGPQSPFSANTLPPRIKVTRLSTWNHCVSECFPLPFGPVHVFSHLGQSHSLLGFGWVLKHSANHRRITVMVMLWGVNPHFLRDTTPWEAVLLSLSPSSCDFVCKRFVLNTRPGCCGAGLCLAWAAHFGCGSDLWGSWLGLPSGSLCCCTWGKQEARRDCQHSTLSSFISKYWPYLIEPSWKRYARNPD